MLKMLKTIQEVHFKYSIMTAEIQCGIIVVPTQFSDALENNMFTLIETSLHSFDYFTKIR